VPNNALTKSKSWPPKWVTPVDDKEIKRSRGKHAINFINAMCIQTKDTVAGRSGEPIVLRDWQEDLLNNVFALTPEKKLKHRLALVGMARKNGKSAMSSGIALWGLFTGENGGEIYSCAADRDQARIVFGDAKKMIEANADLSGQVKMYRDAIEIPSTGSIYRVLSSEAFTKEGLSPSLVIYDELHAAPNRELFDVMQLGMGARREPLLLAITTAGVKADSSGQDSVAYALYQYGQKVSRGEVLDPSFFMAWWEAPVEANHRDPETWKLANPAYADLNSEEDFISAVKRTPEAEFRTKRTNAWVSNQTAWLPNGTWDSCALDKELNEDTEIILGFDGSFSGDASVIVGVTLEEIPHVFLVKAWEKQVTDVDDWRVDITDVENTILDFCGKHKVKEVACDPFRWQRSMQVLQEAGVPIVEWPSTSAMRMVPACSKFYDAVSEQKLTHDNNPLLARHLSNAVVKIDRLGPRIVKEHRGSPRKIDAAVASIIAFDRATVSRQEPEQIVPGFISF
jgi:phage terminase large subunit-like protein